MIRCSLVGKSAAVLSYRDEAGFGKIEHEVSPQSPASSFIQIGRHRYIESRIARILIDFPPSREAKANALSDVAFQTQRQIHSWLAGMLIAHGEVTCITPG